jgi:hypothetical protein
MPNSTRGESEQMLLFQFFLDSSFCPALSLVTSLQLSAYLFENLNRGEDRSATAKTAGRLLSGLISL